MAVMAYAVPLDQIAVAAEVIFFFSFKKERALCSSCKKRTWFDQKAIQNLDSIYTRKESLQTHKLCNKDSQREWWGSQCLESTNSTRSNPAICRNSIQKTYLYMIQIELRTNKSIKKWINGKFVVTSNLNCTPRQDITRTIISYISGPCYVLTIIVLIDHTMKNFNHYN